MVLSIKDIIQEYGIVGDILLYRDSFHRKEGMMKYLKQNLNVGSKTLCTYSDGAFGLWLARTFSNNDVITCYKILSHDYGELMQKTSNLTLIPNTNGLSAWKEWCKGKNYFFINQFEDSIVKDYYKEHFQSVVDALKGYKVDAFCDCGHSCATIAGFIEANIVDWDFVLGVNLMTERKTIHHLKPYKDKVTQCTTLNFNTLELGKKIEARHPMFGNVYEATRSISAAMTWLKENPNKTVVVYVGDSFAKEGTKFGQDK